jgi:hypothetical protein
MATTQEWEATAILDWLRRKQPHSTIGKLDQVVLQERDTTAVSAGLTWSWHAVHV